MSDSGLYGEKLKDPADDLKHRAAPALRTGKENQKMAILWFCLIGIVAGWLAGQLMKGGGFGVVGDLIVGVLGALLGGYLFGLMGIGSSGIVGQLVVATVGAIVLLLIIHVVKRA
jgi:uncharacterized membrane protein YeaQ/YmgE (transglycosylase-associated protein family)